MWLPLLIILIALVLWTQEQITVTVIEQPPIVTMATATEPHIATTTESAKRGRQIHIRKINPGNRIHHKSQPILLIA